MGQPMSKSDEELEIQALRRVISAYLKYVCQFWSNFTRAFVFLNCKIWCLLRQ